MYTLPMKKLAKIKNFCGKFYIVGILFVMMLLSGCESNGRVSQDEPVVDAEGEEAEVALYMIMEHDTAEETLTLYSYQTGYTHYYEYAFSTSFKDKYGKYKTSSIFSEGDVVTIGTPDEEGYLTEVQMSDAVWKYEDIQRFSIDEEGGIFAIAGTNYSILDGVTAFSQGEKIPLDEISENDVLSVTGIDRKILSIVVTTGHGTLSFSNTELFEGSLMQLNKDIFLEITENMEVEIPEGNYTLTVANNGWGGSCEIQVIRSETTEVDLDTLKGEGKKTGLITFSITPLDASVYLDGKLIDVSGPVDIYYGTHTLKIEAEGYESWKKYLTVNSEEATLVIELTTEEEAESESKDSEETETSEDAETSEETETEGTDSDSQSEYEKRQEELEDLQETINDIIENTFGGIFD